MRVLTRQEWNEIIQQVNELRQNPPADTDCEALDEIDEVDANHIWTFSDIQEVQDALAEMCPDISFSDVGPLWKEQIIQEINDAMGQAWCDCEPDEDECDQEMIDAENGLELSLMNNAPPRINCPGDEGTTVLLRDTINGMQIGAPGIYSRIWRVFRRNTDVNGCGCVYATALIATGVVSCQGKITYTGSAQMSTTSGVSCGCCPGCSPPGVCEIPSFCADVAAICNDLLVNGFTVTNEWVLILDTGSAVCAGEDDPCP